MKTKERKAKLARILKNNSNTKDILAKQMEDTILILNDQVNDLRSTLRYYERIMLFNFDIKV